MSNERSHPFIDRREALALFDLVRGRRPREPWPLLPLLAFIGPGGSGKSRLIEHLRTTTCRFGEGRCVLPHASLDFTLLDAPKNLLDIFIALRDELHGKIDGEGKRLDFPRFDLGASIAAASATDGALASPSPGELRSHLTRAQAVFTSIGEMGNALGNLVPVIPPLIVGIKSAAHFPPLSALVQHLQRGPGWRWYREHGNMLGLRAADGIEQVLLRLHEMSAPGTSQRETLVEELLPAAFLDDLYEALVGPSAPKAFSATANVILFLDGYEALMDTSRELALRLLHLLVCNERRRRGETDPLLVVVGSRNRLLDHPDAERSAEQHPPFEVPAASVEEEARAWARTHYQEWAKRLPPHTQVLRLQDLYLPVFLRDFDAHGTRSLFFQLASARDLEERFTPTHGEQLAQAIHRVTRGHPLFVTLAAEAVFEAELRGEPLSPAEFDRALVSSRRAEDTRIGDYLLDLYLKQLSKAERKQLIFSAIPRSVSVEVLRVAVPLPTELDAQEYWERYRRYTFFRAIDHERLVLHHLVRKLLLERVPEGDYTDIHTRLYWHFARHHRQGDEAAGIEETYHALALGNPQPAIALGAQAQQESSTGLWPQLLEAVAQAPTRRIPAQAEEAARTALQHARRSHTAEAGVAAIVGLQWMLNRVQDDPDAAADRWYALGEAYSLLPGGDRQANLERALRCFQEVLQVRTRQKSPTAWALVQQRLAEVYGKLPRGDRQANQEEAIACCMEALTIFTREASPVEWAAIQVTLGEVYRERVKEERRANLEYAIACCEAAFEVYTPEAFPVEWAETLVRLGDAYQARIEGTRQENLERALAYYEGALSTYTRGAFPVEWAATQASKGGAYRVRISGERRHNLNVAIACCRAALEVYTPETLPVEWASTQLSLGRAYQEQAVEEGVWEGLQTALNCYERALSVYIQGAFPVEWAAAQRCMGDAFRQLREGDRYAHLECALTCYERALSVYTRDAFPGAHRDIQLERAEVEAERGNWLQAHVAYAGACEAEELLLRLGSGAMGHDRIVLEGREAALRNGYALAQLGRFAEASIAMEGGQAHWMEEAQLLSPASIERISNQERRERYNSVRQRLIAAQADLDRVPLPDASEREQRRALLGRIAALRKAQAAFDTLIAEIRAAHDPADFLDDVLDAEVVLRAAARGGAGHALVYLAATPWGGVAVAVLHADSALGTAGRFAALSLPHLTTSLLEDLVETTLNDDGRPVIGGYLHAQYGKALALLEHDWGGQTFRESATALHAACVAAGKGSTFDLAARQLLEAPALASSLDTPFAALDPQQSSVLANTFGHVFLQHELERCLRALSSTALTPLMVWLRGEGARSLTLIPCAKLAIFPLTSVLLPDGRTVGETLPASMAPSARALLPYGRGGLTRSWVYALGDPRPTQQELLWAMSEAISVARLAQQEGMHASVKVGRKATRRYVMEALQRAAVASLCCHGQFDAGNPSQSGVQLAEGEWLRREDLLNQKIDLRGLRLLTLSACQTGLIDARGAASEGRGLAADFLQAGADAVVASLWVVDDAATYLLMVRFMQEWFSCRCSEPPAQALACAQHWLRTVTNAELQEWRASSPLLSWPTQVEEPFAEEGGSLVGGAARRIAVRGRGYRLDADAAEKLIRLKATRSDLSAVPYADPYFWAGFQVMGW